MALGGDVVAMRLCLERLCPPRKDRSVTFALPPIISARDAADIAAAVAEAVAAGPITRWTKAYWEAVHPYNLAGASPNFMMDDKDDARLKATFGDNYDRLTAAKKSYDPTNLFRVNQNIRPAV
jgi:hypothetical protein